MTRENYKILPYVNLDNNPKITYKVLSTITVDGTIYGYGDHYEVKESTTYTQGTYIDQALSSSSNSYPNNGQSGSYWYVYNTSAISSYNKGATNYGTVVSENSSAYPNNGRHSDGYWYIRK